MNSKPLIYSYLTHLFYNHLFNLMKRFYLMIRPSNFQSPSNLQMPQIDPKFLKKSIALVASQQTKLTPTSTLPPPQLKNNFSHPLVAASNIPFLQLNISDIRPSVLNVPLRNGSKVAQLTHILSRVPHSSPVINLLSLIEKNIPKTPQEAIFNLQLLQEAFSSCAKDIIPSSLHLFFHKTQTLLPSLSQNYEPDEILVRFILPVCDKLGKLKDKIGYTNQIKNRNRRDYLFSSWITECLTLNRPQEASLILNLSNLFDKNWEWIKIADCYIRTNQLEFAELILPQITNEIENDKMRVKLFDLYLKRDVKSALKIARGCEIDETQSLLMTRVIEFFLSIKNFHNALIVAKEMPKDEIQVNMFWAIYNTSLPILEKETTLRMLQQIPRFKKTYDPLQLTSPLRLNYLSTEFDILAPQDKEKMDFYWANLNNNPKKMMQNFVYKVLGSNYLGFDGGGGLVAGDLKPWINHLSEFQKTAVIPGWSYKIEQILNELSFAYQVRYAAMHTRFQEHLLACHILTRLAHLPLPHLSKNSAFVKLLLLSVSKHHQVMVMIQRQDKDHFSLSIINSGEGSSILPENQVVKEKIVALEAQREVIRQECVLEKNAQKRLELIEWMKKINLQIDELRKVSIRAGHLTYKDLTLKELNASFFLKLSESKNFKTMANFLDWMREELISPDGLNFTLSGRPHKLQKMDNCTVKSISLTIRERAESDALYHNFKAFMTYRLVTDLEQFIAALKPNDAAQALLIPQAKLLFNEGKKILDKRVSKASHLLKKEMGFSLISKK